MAILEGGDIGVDEGGIFQALQDPMWSQVVVKTRHNKAGKVTSVTTTTKQITGAQGLAIVMGPALLYLLLARLDDEDSILNTLLGVAKGAWDWPKQFWGENEQWDPGDYGKSIWSRIFD